MALEVQNIKGPINILFQEYNFGLAQYFGAGIMACIRGSRIYDSLDTKIIVQKWIRFYKVRSTPYSISKV